ncbi:2819_t:CDS:2, partial [Scutellospora calospora]
DTFPIEKSDSIIIHNHAIITDNTSVPEEPNAQDLIQRKSYIRLMYPKIILSHKENNEILYLPILGIKESFLSKIAMNNLPERHLKVIDRLVNIRNQPSIDTNKRRYLPKQEANKDFDKVLKH